MAPGSKEMNIDSRKNGRMRVFVDAYLGIKFMKSLSERYSILKSAMNFRENHENPAKKIILNNLRRSLLWVIENHDILLKVSFPKM